VQDLLDARVGHDRRKRGVDLERDGVEQGAAALVVAELEEADLLEVVEEGVGLGVEGEGLRALERASVLGEFPGRSDPDQRCTDAGRE
jgi:hypothetical protein